MKYKLYKYIQTCNRAWFEMQQNAITNLTEQKVTDPCSNYAPSHWGAFALQCYRSYCTFCTTQTTTRSASAIEKWKLLHASENVSTRFGGHCALGFEVTRETKTGIAVKRSAAKPKSLCPRSPSHTWSWTYETLGRIVPKRNCTLRIVLQLYSTTANQTTKAKQRSQRNNRSHNQIQSGHGRSFLW